jgi:two-component system sensor histidine kinase DegS
MAANKVADGPELKAGRDLSIRRVVKKFNRPGIWILIALFLPITFLQYAAYTEHPSFLAHLTADLGLTRYTVERILFLLPIMWAGFLFGWRGGAITSLAAVGFMLPRALFASPEREDALVETVTVFLIGNLVSYWLESLRKERGRRAQLEDVQSKLEIHLSVIEADEKRLAALNKTASISSRSLELNQVFAGTVDCVMDVMKVDAVLMYVLDDFAGELVLSSYKGVSEKFIKGVEKLKTGEGFNGRVAETGEPLYVEDAAEDPRLAKEVVREEKIRSQLIVPLKSKGRVVGTVCAAVHSLRAFPPEEVDLLTSVGNQIGVAIENASLYQKEREAAEQLRLSEQRYRELFENAHDAIWLHDMEGNILAANEACARLTGYSLNELRNLKTIKLFAAESLEVAREIENRVLRGEAPGALDELKIIKKDGNEALVQLTSSLVYAERQPVAFQHIGRDITDEKRMQENSRFLLQEITRAQEEERKRIARELHDDTIQSLVVHSQQIYNLASSQEKLPEGAVSRLEELREQANSIIRELRRLSQDLRPAALERLGLLSALRRLSADIAEHSGIATRINVIGDERRLPNEVELILFRIVQEALRNVWKHAQATSAEITVEFAAKKIRVIVSDNGKGFDTDQVTDDVRHGKLGLAGMRERASLVGGTLAVKSAFGQGTTLTAEIPV